MPAHDEVGPLWHYVVGIDSMLFDHPLAAVVRAPEAKARRGNKATIAQRLHIADAHQAAPGARADDRADFLFAEEPREGISARTGQFVDQHDLRPEDTLRRPGKVLRIARSDIGQELPLELLGEKVRNVAAAVVALIDDDAVLIELRVERF